VQDDPPAQPMTREGPRSMRSPAPGRAGSAPPVRSAPPGPAGPPGSAPCRAEPRRRRPRHVFERLIGHPPMLIAPPRRGIRPRGPHAYSRRSSPPLQFAPGEDEADRIPRLRSAACPGPRLIAIGAVAALALLGGAAAPGSSAPGRRRAPDRLGVALAVTRRAGRALRHRDARPAGSLRLGGVHPRLGRHRAHLPRAHARGAPRPAPLVVMLHGGGGSAAVAEQYYGWDQEADREGS
jgi:hypothetical protein